jgi:predicted secreted acid phosphatase
MNEFGADDFLQKSLGLLLFFISVRAKEQVVSKQSKNFDKEKTLPRNKQTKGLMTAQQKKKKHK